MSKVLQNAPREHSAICSTFIKLPFVIKIFVLSIFELPFYIGFTIIALYAQKHPINTYADVSSRARSLKFGLNFHPNFV